MYSDKVLKRFKKPKFAGVIKNPDGTGRIGNAKCILPDEKIHINNKIIGMKNLTKEDKIISHDGRYHNISKIYSQKYEGKVIMIKNKLGKTTMTPEHLVYAIKIPKKYFLHTKVKKRFIPAWYHARDLERRDVILFPVLNEIVEKKYVNVDLSTKKYDFKSIKIPKRVTLTNKFLRLCGYYLAEGHAQVKTCRNIVTFAFHIKEKEYVQDVTNIVKEVLGLKTSIKENPKKKTTIVAINNVFVAKLLKELFGAGARNKKIPDFIMLLPPTKQKSLILGMWRGDGYLTLKRKFPRASYSTISEQLIHQLKTLLLRQNIVPSIYYEKERIKNGVHHKEAYRLHVGDRDSMIKLMKIMRIRYKYKEIQSNHSWFDKNYFYTPISNYETKDYEGKVYNLEVPETHSFTTNSLLVHNCGDIMEIYIKVDKKKGKEYIKDIKFHTFGCVAAIASSDVLCELAKGKTIEQAEKIKDKDIAKALDGLPQLKVHCSVLGASALHEAIKDYKKKNP